MRHNLIVTFEKGGLWTIPVKRQIRRSIESALFIQGVQTPCEISVLVCSDATIQSINLAQRNIDKPTDVLSFPMFNLTPGVLPNSWEDYRDPGTGFVPLGDMAISYERAAEQAKQFGHSVKREVCYLTVHSVLHLLGYDHVDEGEMKKQMRAAEERILKELALSKT